MGTHTFRFEPPDIFWACFHGVLSVADATLAVNIYREMSEVRPFVFVAEVKEMSRLEPEAARYLSDHLPSEWVLGNIYIGARLLHRALAKGFALASLVSLHPDAHALDKVHFVSTPEQARELILQLRARHARGA
jgi:hypothetical protein